MLWRLVKSLDTLRAQVRAVAPLSVPPATPASSWGTIGDEAHTSTSDHSPHVYAALGSTPVVCAADFPHAPWLGLDGHAFTEALRLSRDPRIAYVIFDGRIFSSVSTPWIWRTYTGSDQHREHWHVSTVHTGSADNTSPWRMPGVTTGDDMNLGDQSPWSQQFTQEAGIEGPWLGGNMGNQLQYLREDSHFARRLARQTDAKVTALKSVIDSLAAVITSGGGNVDTAAILEAMDAKLAELAREQRDAVADLGEGGATQVRGPQAG